MLCCAKCRRTPKLGITDGRLSSNVKFLGENDVGHIERATPKGGAALRDGTVTNAGVGVTLPDDAPLAHPCSGALARARRDR